MSWFFGVAKTDSNADIRKYQIFHDNPSLVIDNQYMYLAIGGIRETRFCQYDEDLQKGWTVAGLGLRIEDSAVRILDENDWRTLLAAESFDAGDLDGHFIAIRWENGKIECMTDQLGVRSLYYTTAEDGVVFSTRLDWTARAARKTRLHTASVGCRWLLSNQFGHESGVDGIERSGPAGRLIINNAAVEKNEYRHWLPSFGGGTDSELFSRTLLALVCPSNCGGRSVSLGLSGGLDSRILLALLMANGRTNFLVHTFGEEDDPDVRVSKSIADACELTKQSLNDPLPDADELIRLAGSFASQNHLNEPVSHAARCRYYTYQHSRNQIMIDGAYGEFARRQYLNWVVRFGRTALRNSNIPKLFSLLSVPRPDIFTADFNAELLRTAESSLERTLRTLPSVDEIGIENYVDLLAVRTKIPAIGGPEQSRSDAYCLNYMPFIQPTLLKDIFLLDVRYRRNRRVFRDMIRKYSPHLRKYPLVKGGISYPFNVNTTGAWFIRKVKNVYVKPYSDTAPTLFLDRLKIFILDVLHSAEVRNCEYYDYATVRSNTEKYYKGDAGLEGFVNWWLTFDLWRRSMKNGL